MSTEDNKATYRQFVEEVLNKKHVATIDTFFDLNQIDHFAPPGTPGGIEGVRQVLSMFLAAFPDLHVMIEDMIAEEDKVVSRITMSGTQQGVFLDIPPTGKHFSITSIEISRIAGRKIVEHWAELDALGLMQQLGAVPASREAR